MYASHRDACIYSWYAYQLGQALDAHYSATELSDCVIAYRKLSKSNYNFSADVLRFAQNSVPCFILCFDVSDFFGSLDHRLLKDRLKRILNSPRELPEDWHKIYKRLTNYTYINVDTLKAHPIFSNRIKQRDGAPLATIREVRSAGIRLEKNSRTFGIPQGTPISSAFSNLYMMDFDLSIQAYCKNKKALYRRYSDDIIIVCEEKFAADIESALKAEMGKNKLNLNDDKTERHIFDTDSIDQAQYLGFNISSQGATIRQSSLSRQWRKLIKSVKRIKRAGITAMAAGKSDRVYTKTLRRRFTPLQVRNFSSYARRSADALEAPKIRKQVRRLERFAEKELAALRTLKP